MDANDRPRCAPHCGDRGNVHYLFSALFAVLPASNIDVADAVQDELQDSGIIR